MACESLADELGAEFPRFPDAPDPGRENNRVGAKGEDGIDRCAVAASSRHVAAEDLKVLHEVVGERVVVVEAMKIFMAVIPFEADFGLIQSASPRAASSTAFIMAAALFFVS